MDFGAYPNLTFKLDCGRKVKVHAFIWEPCSPELIEVHTSKGKEQVEIERNRFKCSDIIPVPLSKTHVVNWELVDEFVNHPPRCPNCTINVLLSSEPISKDALYSELAVIMFMDYVEGMSIESMLEKYLHDLDWKELATDVKFQDRKIQFSNWSVHHTQ